MTGKFGTDVKFLYQGPSFHVLWKHKSKHRHWGFLQMLQSKSHFEEMVLIKKSWNVAVDFKIFFAIFRDIETAPESCLFRFFLDNSNRFCTYKYDSEISASQLKKELDLKITDILHKISSSIARLLTNWILISSTLNALFSNGTDCDYKLCSSGFPNIDSMLETASSSKKLF